MGENGDEGTPKHALIVMKDLLPGLQHEGLCPKPHRLILAVFAPPGGGGGGLLQEPWHSSPKVILKNACRVCALCRWSLSLGS
jgi:hypothetical protein